MRKTLKAYCERPFNRLKIDSDGSYHSCCHQSTKYGNVLTESRTLEEVFSSAKIKEVKKSVLNPFLHSTCKNKTCPYFLSSLERTKEVEISKYPTDLEIALPSTWCNIGGLEPTPDTACIMCPRSSMSYMDSLPKEDNTDKILEFIKPAMPTLKVLSILGIAEPFFKGKIFEIFDKLDYKRYKENIWFWTFTNGTIFSPQHQDLFIDHYTHNHSLGFSLDAATAETYKKIRRIDSFKTTNRNLERYFNKVNKIQPKQHYSYTTYNINLLNLHEMVQMLRFSHNIGVTKVQFNPTYIPVPGIKLNREMILNERNWQRFWDKQLEVEQLAETLGVELEFYRPFHGGFLNK